MVGFDDGRIVASLGLATALLLDIVLVAALLIVVAPHTFDPRPRTRIAALLPCIIFYILFAYCCWLGFQSERYFVTIGMDRLDSKSEQTQATDFGKKREERERGSVLVFSPRRYCRFVGVASVWERRSCFWLALMISMTENQRNE